MKLLATSMVASSRLGWSSSRPAVRALDLSELFRKLMSFADREKYAVSAPAVIAVSNKRINTIIMSIVAPEDVNTLSDACSSNGKKLVSPSVLSKLFVFGEFIKDKKRNETVKFSFLDLI